MRATIVDSSVLSALSPLDLTSYLRTRGWQTVRQLGPAGALWRSAGDTDYEILAPLDSGLGDFAQRVSEALSTLAAFENRSQIDIFNDINTAGCDLIRVRAIDADYAQGTMPVSEAVVLVERARDMVLAAACAATGPRAVFHTRKPTAATDFMKSVRMGQTEIGSFVVTLQSPVTPILTEILPGTPPQEPFERRVTQTLTTALSAMDRAATQSASDGSIKAFERAREQGVSANLCEAVVGLYEAGSAQSLSVGVSWASTRPVAQPGVPSLVTIHRDALPFLKAAAQAFRAERPDPEAEVRGYVVKLKRNEGDTVGVATLYGVVGGLLRNVRIELEALDYDTALQAHGREKQLRAYGELRREGRSYVLKNVRSLEVEELEDVD
jgi:hypothetical protein